MFTAPPFNIESFEGILSQTGLAGQFLFVPSYFDFVRLRSFLAAEHVDFESLDEYAEGGDVARGRGRFAAGKTRLALYTERAHFYHRRSTKGVKVCLSSSKPFSPARGLELILYSLLIELCSRISFTLGSRACN